MLITPKWQFFNPETTTAGKVATTLARRVINATPSDARCGF